MEEGEINRILDDIRQDSQNMMSDLAMVDDRLNQLRQRVISGEASQDEILRVIDEIRQSIGVIEDEDRKELGEEELADNLLDKLRSWVDKIV